MSARSIDLARYDTTLAEAETAASRSAAEACLPMTVYRVPDSAGWTHTNALSRRLEGALRAGAAAVHATILPPRWFL
jgi:hypothetical protein